MSGRILVAATLAALALAACETTNSDEWIGEGETDFNQAERGCRAQTESIAEEENRPEFFVECMEALGWRPRPGTEYAAPATAPDPT